MWSYDQSLVALAFLQENLNFTRVLPEKPSFFWGVRKIPSRMKAVFFLLDTGYFMSNYIFSFSSLEIWRWWESVDNFSLLDYSMESFMISPSYFQMWDIVAVFTNRCNSTYPVNICLFKVNNRKSRKSCEICLKLQVEQVNVTWEEPIGGSHIFWISALTKSFISFEMIVNKKFRAYKRLLFCRNR